MSSSSSYYSCGTMMITLTGKLTTSWTFQAAFCLTAIFPQPFSCPFEAFWCSKKADRLYLSIGSLVLLKIHMFWVVDYRLILFFLWKYFFLLNSSFPYIYIYKTNGQLTYPKHTIFKAGVLQYNFFFFWVKIICCPYLYGWTSKCSFMVTNKIQIDIVIL